MSRISSGQRLVLLLELQGGLANCFVIQVCTNACLFTAYSLTDPLDALPVSALSHIILDVTYKDPKKRNLLDIPETRDEVLQSVLAAPQVLQGIKGGKIRVVFF